jgi:hypothetical protein
MNDQLDIKKVLNLRKIRNRLLDSQPFSTIPAAVIIHSIKRSIAYGILAKTAKQDVRMKMQT